MLVPASDRAVLLLKSDFGRGPQWLDAFAGLMPELEVRIWPQAGNPHEIEYALLWAPPADLFDGLDRLQVIFSVGAGVDTLLECPALPAQVPIVRMVEPELTAGMVGYVLYQVLRFHRRMHRYQQQQQRRQWQELPQVPASQTTVGIMGMGVLGSKLATQLRVLDYGVIGWSRTAKAMDGVRMFAGERALAEFLGQSDILVVLLPLTGQTRHIINRETLAALPRGAFFVNVGRGGLVNEADLVAALDSGQVEAAALDVFEVEPLPPNHLFWQHPAVTLTPHVASITHPPTAARFVAQGITRQRAGQPLPYLVDRERGY